MKFDQEIMLPLHELAETELKNESYSRLLLVSQYLAVFASGQWQRLGDEESLLFLEKMEIDFRTRTWDDMIGAKDMSYRRATTLISQAKKQYVT